MKKYIMSFDAGTTSSRCIIFDKGGNIVASAQKEFDQIFPKPGYVEHNPLEILHTQIEVAELAANNLGVDFSEIDSIGITNQRETTVVWDRNTGKPIYNAIVWQCRRTADYCEALISKGYKDIIKKKTGLVIDAYFSATKLKWILDNVPGAREKANKGELAFGTIDSWLLYNLTGKKVHATDYSNASRTMLFNINTLTWDDELLELFDIPKSVLPEVMPSSGLFGYTDENLFGHSVPIAGVAGDQQCALFGQTCFDEGDSKNTYGTGCFLLMNVGNKPNIKDDPMISTIAWVIGDKVTYALEGSVFVGGAVVQWLRDQLMFISSAAESETEALKVDDTDGVYVVPAFEGLGAPYWDQYAKGTIVGLTRGSNKYHIIRAALESIAYQSYDIIKAMEKSSGKTLNVLNVDGGACANKFLMQFQSDILNAKVQLPECVESTALGASYLAGLYTGFYESMESLKSKKVIAKSFSPCLDQDKRKEKLDGWQEALKRTFTIQ